MPHAQYPLDPKYVYSFRKPYKITTRGDDQKCLPPPPSPERLKYMFSLYRGGVVPTAAACHIICRGYVCGDYLSV